MKMCNCFCEICNNIFSRPLKEVKRNILRSRKMFCSRACSAKGKHNPGNKANLIAGYVKSDEFSPFREILRRCKRRDKSFDLDLNYLKELWEKQEGKCPYLKTNLILPKTNGKHSKDNPNLIASLDRIDSSKGYIKGNVQYMSMTLNWAKNSYNEETVFNLIGLCSNIHGPV